jgi:hypothetical protein
MKEWLEILANMASILTAIVAAERRSFIGQVSNQSVVGPKIISRKEDQMIRKNFALLLVSWQTLE